MSDWTTTTPVDVDLLTMVRAARTEGLPALIGCAITQGRELRLHADNEADAGAWHAWWVCHEADGWTRDVSTLDEPERGRSSTHHHLTGRWRGSTIDIVHIELRDLEVPA